MRMQPLQHLISAPPRTCDIVDAAAGRPADVEQLPDGSLIVSDDTAGMIYRVTRSRNNN